MQTVTTIAETFTETIAELRRLVSVAHQERVYLVQEPGSGAWIARSSIDPSAHNVLTGVSCTCPRFLHEQRCPHLALLLARLSWLPPLDTEEAHGHAHLT